MRATMDFLLPSQAVATTETTLPPPTTQQNDAEDHVMWQSSQSVVLKQLLRTPDEGVRTSRGWQREPSFDQIPGFSRLSTSDASIPSSSVRPAPARPRRAQSPAVTSTSSNFELPFAADPIQLLHLMKDVSARLDQNVPVRPRSSLGPERTKTERKTRSAMTPFPSTRPAKRSRVDALRSGDQDDETPSIDKGKAKAQPAGDSGIAGPSPSQDITLSQIQMPPPPGPSSKRHIIPPLPSTSAVPAKQHQQHPQPKQPCLPPESAASPALLMKPKLFRAQKSVSKPPAVDIPPEVAPDRRQVHVPVAIMASTHNVTPQPPTASQSAARPPSLGMRRTNTFPMTTSLQKSGALPTRQKGFKPPFLSGSQPQSSSQQGAPTSATLRLAASTGGLSRSSSESPSSFSSNSTATSTATTTTTVSSVSSSSRSTRSSASPAPFEYGARKASSASKSSSASLGANIPGHVPVRKPAGNKDDDVIDSLPEPLDCDADSSFGDMSFDIDADALEATMRLYD